MHSKLLIFFFLLFMTAKYPLWSQTSFDVIERAGDCRRASDKLLVTVPSKVKNTDSFYFQDNMASLYLHREGELYRARLDHISNKKIPLYSILEPLEKDYKSIHPVDRSLVYDFRDFFKDTTYVVAGDSLKLKVHDVSYPIGESNFFVVRFEYEDQVINRRIGNQGDMLHFSKELFYDKYHQPIPRQKMPSAGIYYVQNYLPGDRTHLRPELLYTCRIIFLKPEDVGPFYKNIRHVLYEQGLLDWDRMNNLVCRYVWDLYGYTDPQFMSDWLGTLDP